MRKLCKGVNDSLQIKNQIKNNQTKVVETPYSELEPHEKLYEPLAFMPGKEQNNKSILMFLNLLLFVIEFQDRFYNRQLKLYLSAKF